jgi:UDP-N-acetyl-D-mannosaminuronic acid dehydrogenase|tara:strand:+ start:43 stop:1218 length:1176 start_codon:yes stop_codon:yes gene_type:complete
MKKFDVCIVGGAGHIGLPLGLLLKSKNKRVVLYDKNTKIINKINSGIMPFIEKGANKLLKKNKEKIFATNNIKYIKNVKIVIVCIGTPITNNLKPNFKYFFRLFEELKSHLNKDQVIIIRSSIYPGSCRKIINILGKKFKHISYCPERVVQGLAIKELPKLPQIVSGLSKKSIFVSKKLFKLICKKIIVTTILEAELIKLFSNAWRYINFSISNEFYMICKNLNINYSQLRKIMINGYSRNKDMPLAGFAAGPCLFKDTIQLSAFLKNNFILGKTATLINENLPNFILKKLKEEYKSKLKYKTIGVLGLAFKADIDDARDSLSIKLIKLIKKNKLKVVFSDEYIKHPEGISKKNLVKFADIIIIATPHKAYNKIKFPKNKKIVDTWGIFEK